MWEALTRVPDPRGQFPFHKGVDILGVRVDGETARGEIGRDPGQALPDLLPHPQGRGSPVFEHGGVGQAPRDILPGHAAVEGDGGIEIVGFWSMSFWNRPAHSFMAGPPFFGYGAGSAAGTGLPRPDPEGPRRGSRQSCSCLALLLLFHRLHLNRQAEEVDEALAVGLVVDMVLVEGGDLLVIQGIGEVREARIMLPL